MNTDDLISALAADAQTQAPPLSRVWACALAAGLVASALFMIATLGPRTDMAYALSTVRFDFKFVATLALAVPAALLAHRLSDPSASLRGRLATLALAPALLAIAIGLELAALPRPQWWPNMIGANTYWCMGFVPLYSLPVLAALLLALRRGAPMNARLAGVMAGLAAGGFGGAIYAAHCTDDSPLFLAVWYSIGIAIVTALGAYLGPRFLKW